MNTEIRTCRNLCSMLFVAVAAVLSSSAHAGPITTYPANNGFERPDLGSASNYQYNPTVAASSWTFVGGAGIASNGTGGFNVSAATNANSNGDISNAGQAAFLQKGDGTLTGASFSQAITLPGDVHNTLTFSDEYRVGGVANGINVYLNGSLVNATPLYPSSDSVFNTATLSLGALTHGSYTLSFAGANPNGNDNTSFIDNVSITSTAPEPASCVLFGLGALGLLIAARRRRKA